MDIRLSNGAVIATDNPEVIEQHLKFGGVEIKPVEVAQPTPKKSTKKSQE